MVFQRIYVSLVENTKISLFNSVYFVYLFSDAHWSVSTNARYSPVNQEQRDKSVSTAEKVKTC